MFALGLHYLNGWSMAAADGARKERPEWPPHPDRVFMALAAAWFETGEDGEEGAALRWLETLSPPAIAASDAACRTAVRSYVPVNDDGGGKKSSPRTEVDKLRNRGLALIPEHRLRQPRGFPVAIPHVPTVHLIWRKADLGGHNAALERLAAKVTHIGHPASLVQAWVQQDSGVVANWEPTEGIAAHRLRIPSVGSLDRLARPFQEAWTTFHDHLDEIERAETDMKAMTPPPRTPWRNFPDAVLLAPEPQAKRHSEYAAAKSGDHSAAVKLVESLVDAAGTAAVRRLVTESAKSRAPVLVCAHAYESEGVNAIFRPPSRNCSASDWVLSSAQRSCSPTWSPTPGPTGTDALPGKRVSRARSTRGMSI